MAQTRKRRRFGTVRTVTQRGIEYVQGRFATPQEWLDKDQTLPKTQTMTVRAEFISDVEAWLHENETLIRANKWIPKPVQEAITRRSEITFAEYANQWLETRSKANGQPIRATTKEKHRELLDRHLIPFFGDRLMVAITYQNVKEWYEAMLDKRRREGTSGQGVRYNAYILLKAIMRSAAETPINENGDTLIARTPVRLNITKPKKVHKTVIAQPEEILYIAECAPPRLALAFLLGGVLGLREGEIVGIQRRDFMSETIELDNGDTVDVLTVHIFRAVKALNTPEGRVLSLGVPKTETGERGIIVPPFLEPHIEHHLEKFTGPEPNAQLFTSMNGGLLPGQTLRNSWYKVRAKAAMKYPRLATMTVHDLRHTALTRFAGYKATEGELKAIGGHASIQSVGRYQHAAADHLKHVYENLNDDYTKKSGITENSTQSETPTNLTVKALAPIIETMDTSQIVTLLHSLGDEAKNSVLKLLPQDKLVEVLSTSLGSNVDS